MSEFKTDYEGDCPECSREDEEIMWLECCGVYRCYDCWVRHEEKWSHSAAAALGEKK